MSDTDVSEMGGRDRHDGDIGACATCGGLGLTGERDEWGFGKPCPACDGTGEAVWRGVYPGYCINPETCRGYTHCPRNYSCVE